MEEKNLKISLALYQLYIHLEFSGLSKFMHDFITQLHVCVELICRSLGFY